MVEYVLRHVEAASSTFELYFVSSFVPSPLSCDYSGFYLFAPAVHGRWSSTSRGSGSRTCRVKVARRQSSHGGKVDRFLCLELEGKPSSWTRGSRSCFFWRFQERQLHVGALTGKGG